MTEQQRAGASGDVSLAGLSKHYGDFTAVRPMDLTIPAGSFFALLGASGCGKTTTLRMIAGLEQPSTGTVHIGDRDVTALPPYKRPVNTVFQNYALFPHLSVADNVGFGLRRRGVKDTAGQVKDMLDLVELGHLAKRKPTRLSGGQQQRVAVARALINTPQVLLLDEPLGALDLKLRRQMQLELKRIQTDVGITFVHVTHDQEEAMTMADTIAVMNGGRIEQLGSPVELYESPRTTFVANFLGQSNLVEARVTGRADGDLLLDAQGNRLVLPAARSAADGERLVMGIRPEKITIVHTSDAKVADGRNRLDGGVIVDAAFIGVSTQYVVRMPWGQEFTVFEQNMERDRRLVPGAGVLLHWNPEHGFGLESGDLTAGVAEASEDAA
ncbi:ABC transporter ATP-binding protein [Embleya hyalina]|uniref:Spermidine/putrescine import ATP-binding protein PotA n=1 Tax=Embleya hyalina TaxID=516124 RepID=A0A401YP37_9ACTN|nr:ABC transporter ATP-binding protein [Embleya hyalina]GCD96412.1 polyamine-transporting ATPase [Embleya hyalina]